MQRVLSASVTVDNVVVSNIGKGILIFVAVAPGDTHAEVDRIATKLVKHRYWDDEATGGRWKHSLKDINGEILAVSQFTLLARTNDGQKPSFHGAMDPVLAKELYDRFVSRLKNAWAEEKVKEGVFQAMMEVALVNDGPVTLEFNVDAPKPKDPAQIEEAKMKKKKEKANRPPRQEGATATPVSEVSKTPAS